MPDSSRKMAHLLSTTALVLVSSLGMSSVVRAGDLRGFSGEGCCSDLEERVAELEVGTLRKGNRRISLKLSGFVNKALFAWDDGDRSDTYIVGGADNYASRFAFKGKAKIGRGWSAGFLLEWSTLDSSVAEVNQDNDDGRDAEGLRLRHDVFYLDHERFGTLSMGHSSVATDGVSEIDFSGATLVTTSSASDWVASFNVAGGVWGDFISNIDGFRQDMIRYDSPNMRGLTASVSFGEDDYWDVALRYANEFGNAFRVAAAIGYRQNRGESVIGNGANDLESVHGSVSMLHIPTGMNTTIAAGQQDDGNTIADFFYVKAGFNKRLSRLGATAVYGEYGVYDGFGLHAGLDITGSRASVWGLGLTQKIDQAALEIYVGYRQYSLDVTSQQTNQTGEFSAVLMGGKLSF